MPSDLLNLRRADLNGLQEVGGCLDIPSWKWDTRPVWLINQSYKVLWGRFPFVATPIG